MLKKLFGKTIAKLAHEAVIYVEESINTEKKQAATNFIIERLPIPPGFKKIFGIILFDIIDESIEYAVRKLNASKEKWFSVCLRVFLVQLH